MRQQCFATGEKASTTVATAQPAIRDYITTIQQRLFCKDALINAAVPFSGGTGPDSLT